MKTFHKWFFLSRQNRKHINYFYMKLFGELLRNIISTVQYVLYLGIQFNHTESCTLSTIFARSEKVRVMYCHI